MKLPKRVKIIANNPDNMQDDIIALIGNEYDVILFDKNDNSVSVVIDESNPKWNTIVLNENEYETLEYGKVETIEY